MLGAEAAFRLREIGHAELLQGGLQAVFGRRLLARQVVLTMPAGRQQQLAQTRQIERAGPDQQDLALPGQSLHRLARRRERQRRTVKQLELQTRRHGLALQDGFAQLAVQLAQRLQCGLVDWQHVRLLPQRGQSALRLRGQINRLLMAGLRLQRGGHLLGQGRPRGLLVGQQQGCARRLAARAGRLGLGCSKPQSVVGHRQLLGGHAVGGLALVGLLLLPGKAIKLSKQELMLLLKLGVARAGIGELLLRLPQRLQGASRGEQRSLQGVPGSRGRVLRLLAAQLGEAIHIALVSLHQGGQGAQLGAGRSHALLCLVQLGTRLAGGREQLTALGQQGRQHGVATTGRNRAGGGLAEPRFLSILQGVVQMLARECRRLAQFLARALLHPQQARDAPMLGLAGPLAGKTVAKHLGQMVFGLRAIERRVADAQIAARLAAQKGFDQRMGLAIQDEIKRDGGRGGAVAPGPQIVHRLGPVALEECGADGPHQGAFAGLVGAAEDVEPGAQPGQLERLPKLADLLHTQAGQMQAHACALASVVVRMASAARAISAASPGPACSACSSAITSAR